MLLHNIELGGNGGHIVNFMAAQAVGVFFAHTGMEHGLVFGVVLTYPNDRLCRYCCLVLRFVDLALILG